MPCLSSSLWNDQNLKRFLFSLFREKLKEKELKREDLSVLPLCTDLHPSYLHSFLSPPTLHMSGLCSHSSYSTLVLSHVSGQRKWHCRAQGALTLTYQTQPLAPLPSDLMRGVFEMWCCKIQSDNVAWCTFIHFVHTHQFEDTYS